MLHAIFFFCTLVEKKISIPKLLLGRKSLNLNPTISKMFRFSFEVKLKLLIHNICGPIKILLMPIFPNGKHYETHKYQVYSDL